MRDKAQDEAKPLTAVEMQRGVIFSICSYDKIRASLRFKKYSNSVDFNMDRNGWNVVCQFEADEGVSSRKEVEEYINVVQQGGDYCYRRFSGPWGLPWITLYKKKI